MIPTDPIISFQGEVQILSWAETNSRGRTITLQINDDSEGHPFAAARTKQGKTAGQRYQIVMVQIGDDERPVQKTPAQMAFLLCKDEAFQHFINERSFVDVHDEATARYSVLQECGIKSRSELDTNPVARSLWLTFFYNPWTAYQASIQQVI